MKLKTKEQGVVLVITLIMLSVVTLMAIVFLGVSRRERGHRQCNDRSPDG